MIAKVARDARAYHANLAAPAYLAFVGLEAAGPRLLGHLDDDRLVLLEELPGPSLADLLLGADRAAAEAALLAHAELLGEISARTRGGAETYASLGGPQPYPADELLRPFSGAVAEVMEPPDLEAELAALEEFSRAWDRAAFSPGDTCPDNNAWAAGRLRLFDFDFAGFQHAALAFSYFDIPWSTCWCLAALPEEVRERLRAAFLARCRVTDAEAAQAAAFWSVFNTGAMLPRALAAGGPIALRSPTGVRTMLVWRLDQAVRRLAAASTLPRLATVLAELAERLRERWDEPGVLPRYPVFTGL